MILEHPQIMVQNILMDPGTDGANLHPNFSGPDKLSPDAKSNVAELDILQ